MASDNVTLLSQGTHDSAGLPGARWKKSSQSMSNGNCVEVARVQNGYVGVRDSKDKTGPILLFTPDGWDTFLGSIYKGQFDAEP